MDFDDRFEYLGDDKVLFTPKTEREKKIAEMLISLSEDQVELLKHMLEYVQKR